MTEYKKIDTSEKNDSFKYYTDCVPAHQVLVYTMCGGGFLGRFAAQQPGDFYIDMRVGGLPYSKRQIEQAVKVLATIAKLAGLDPKNLPSMPKIHNSGIF